MKNLNTLVKSSKLINQLSDEKTPKAIRKNIQLLTRAVRVVGAKLPALPISPIERQEKLIAVFAESLAA